MWTCVTQPLARETHRYIPRRDGQTMSYGEVIQRWTADEAFRRFFVGLLAGSPFASFRLETPPITRSTAATRDFEFVLIDTPALPRKADAAPFAAHFSDAALAVAFPNLGRDATLIVPCPRGPADHYAHLAPFVRNASPAQVDAFWRLAGETIASQWNERPLWLSTAGLGVSWLHLRVDVRPKYYAHQPYWEEKR